MCIDRIGYELHDAEIILENYDLLKSLRLIDGRSETSYQNIVDTK